MIVRNEESYLARCLESVRGLADDIVVVDTGSSDGTTAIARAFGARVFDFPWRDDFSRARNFSLEQAAGSWILVLDADESVAARDRATIRGAPHRDEVNVVVVPQRHYLASGTIAGWQAGSGGYDEGLPFPGFFDVDCRRLFRNRPWLRFQNRVHETIVSTDSSHPVVAARGNWVIHHFGKAGDADVLRAKAEAYLRMGIGKAEEDPSDPRAHYELGIQYAEISRHEAALASFERALALVPGFSDVPFRIALCLCRLDRHREALAALRTAARTLPQLASEIALEEGNAHRALGDAAAAECAYRRALANNPLFALAGRNLAQLFWEQQRPAEALACLDRTLDRSPRHLESRLSRARVRRDMGDHAGALADLELLGSYGGAPVLRVRLLTQQRRFEEARACLAGIDRTSAASGELDALDGAIALGLGDVAGAAAALQKSLAIEPTYEVARNLATALDASGDREGALQAAADALRLSPDTTPAIASLAQLAGDRFRTRAPDDDPRVLTLFFYQPHSVVFDARTPRTRGLGGTESAVVYLAEALARRGHRIVVFNNCDEPGWFDGVEYARWETLPPRCVGDRPDVLVAVRAWQLLGQVRLAPLQVFWTCDAFDQPFLENLGDACRRAEIDLFMLQSDWQAATFEAHHQVPVGQIVRSRLGAAASAIASPARPVPGTRRHRLAYASTPFRGLDVLLDLFPRIRAACPDAELDVFSSMQVYGVSAADDRKQFRGLYRKAKQPGVHLIGTVPQAELAARLGEVRILAYPNHYPETFCVAAIEAQAAGCAVVTSALGALPQTVGDGGLCIPGDPRSAPYQEAFVAACVGLLTDDARWQAMSERALARAWEHYTWPQIGDEWETLLRAALTVEPPVVARVAVHLSAGRAALAQRMLQAEARPSVVAADVWALLLALAAWRCGEGPAVSDDNLRRLALHFRSFRRSGFIESMSPPATPSAGAAA
jgi:glycosyltransferase involved in cell wall biosynthesis/Tfp pilus assembly protein PilF